MGTGIAEEWSTGSATPVLWGMTNLIRLVAALLAA
jgi:hypothetical protein